MGQVIAWVRSAARTAVVNVDVLLLAALASVAVVPFGRLFVDNSFLLLPAGGALVAAVVSLALSSRRPLSVALAVSAVGIAAYLTFGSFHVGVPTATALRGVWDGVTGSWSALLTASLPAVSTARLTALPVLLAWGSTLVGGELSLRTRSAAAPIVPALAVFGVALAFTGKRPLGSIALPLFVVVLVIAVVFLRANGVVRQSDPHVRPAAVASGTRPAPTAARNHLAFGLPALAVIALAATGLGAALPQAPENRRFDLHDRYHPPVQLSDALSPLAEIRSQLNDNTTASLFTVRFSGVPAGMKIDRVPIAILDQYDGAVWGTNAAFDQVGHELPPGPVPNLPAATIRQTYELHAYSSSFLPALERPTLLDGKGLAYDRVTGMLATSTVPPSKYQYSVESTVSDYGQAATKPVKAGNDPSVSALALPPPGFPQWPDKITSFANSVAVNGSGPYAKLQSLSEDLSGPDFGYSVAARPGHSLGVITDFLTAPTASVALGTARIGYDEQFAAAFAIVARADGFPSRVVVGYLVDPNKAIAGQSIDVLPNQVTAWAEVNLNGIGWVPFTPTNRKARQPILPPPTTVATSQPTTATTSGGSNAQGPGPTVPTKQHHTNTPLWPLAILAILVAVPTLISGAKSIRRRHRETTGVPAQRVMGAWFETRDELRAHGARVARSMTVSEAAEVCARTLDTDAAGRVAAFAPIVDDALYGPSEPADELAGVAWELQAVVAKVLSDHASTPQRLRAAVDPRPLLPLGGRR